MRLPRLGLSSPYAPSFFLALRGALAVAISWQLTAALFGAHGATLAPISALLVIQPTGWQSLRRAGERLAGVALGVSIAALAAHFFGVSFGMLAVVVALAYVVGFAVQKQGAYLASQVPVSATLGLLVGSQTGAYPVERTVGAIIGGVIGTVLSLLLTPPFYVEQARTSVSTSARAMADGMTPLVAAFTQPTTSVERQQTYAALCTLEEQVGTTEQALALGVESTKLNLWARGAAQRLEDYPLIVLNLQRVMRQLRRIAYTLQEDAADRDAIATLPWSQAYASLLGDIQTLLTRMADRLRPTAPSPPGPDDLKAVLAHAQTAVQEWETRLESDVRAAPMATSALVLRGALLLDIQRMVAELDAAAAVLHQPVQPTDMP